MRLFSGAAFAAIIALTGCAREATEEPREALPTETEVSREESGSLDISEITPSPRKSAPGSAKSARREITTATAPETTATETETTPTVASAPLYVDEEIVAQPSRHPVEMARTVELRKRLQDVRPDATALSDEQAEELSRFATYMRTFAESKSELSKDQRFAIDEYAGKLEFQVSQMREGRAQPPFDRRLQGVKSFMKEIQNYLAEQSTPSPR